MSNLKRNKSNDFDQIALLIEEARGRAFHKVNEELVLLYFKVGSIVSNKVSKGIWGDKTVHELAVYIENKYPGMKGFNRRGLYRMKQFYETYTAPEFVSPLVTQIESYFTENEELINMSAVPTQISVSGFLEMNNEL